MIDKKGKIMKKSIKYISILALIILAILAFVFFVVPSFITAPKDSSKSDANSNAFKVNLWAENTLENYDFSELKSDEIIIKGKDFEVTDSLIIIELSDQEKAELGEKFYGYWVVVYDVQNNNVKYALWSMKEIKEVKQLATKDQDNYKNRKDIIGCSPLK